VSKIPRIVVSTKIHVDMQYTWPPAFCWAKIGRLVEEISFG